MDYDDKRLLIEYLIAHKNNLWAGFIILTGGLVGLLLSYSFNSEVHSIEDNIKLWLFFIGFSFLVLTGIGLININNEIKNRLK